MIAPWIKNFKIIPFLGVKRGNERLVLEERRLFKLVFLRPFTLLKDLFNIYQMFFKEISHRCQHCKNYIRNKLVTFQEFWTLYRSQILAF